MATVTDSSLLSAAQEVVTDFVDNKSSLNSGVIKKASELGLNDTQTQRLIERTNTEAFLRVYPQTTDFEVADPEIVLGHPVKTAHVTLSHNDYTEADASGMFKAASAQEKYFYKKAASTVPSRYQEKVNKVSELDIFGIDEDFCKHAAVTAYKPAIDPQNKLLCEAICSMNKTASQRAQEDLDREMRFDDAVDDLGEFIKQASLSGTQSIADSEHELLNYYPDDYALITGIYDAVVTKMASEGVNPDTLGRSEDVYEPIYATSSELTDKFKRVLDILHE